MSYGKVDYGAGTILGGLPVIAKFVYGKDPDTPNGPGEHWIEVDEVYWMTRKGERGKPIPAHLMEKARKYDPGLCHLSEMAADDAAYRHWNKTAP